MQIIISCGGGGTRLWPVSTEEHPKQLIALLDDESLMLKTYKRIRQQFSASQIWITVNEKHLDLVKNILPEEFDSTHIITEPVKRDTFAAITLAASVIASRTSADEALIFIPSDDWIESEADIKKLNQAILSIGKSLENGKYDCVTVGIKPKSASSQFGYLEVKPGENNIGEVTEVVSFKEKPSRETAQEYLNSGNFFWHKHNPSLTYNSLKKNIDFHWSELSSVVERVYEKGVFTVEDFQAFPKQSIDYAILEKTDKIGMIPLDINWDDVGTWETVYGYLPKLDGANHLEIEGEDNKVKLEDKNLKVAFVGVSNLLVVQTKDGLLILDPKHSGEVKTVAEHFNRK